MSEWISIKRMGRSILESTHSLTMEGVCRSILKIGIICSAHGLNCLERIKKGPSSCILMMGVVFLTCIMMCVGCIHADDREYQLSEYSEVYNTHYIYHKTFIEPIKKDTVVYIETKVPSSFVVEHSGLNIGEKTIIIYNDTCKIHLTRTVSKYIVNDRTMKIPNGLGRKISLYFINRKVVLYADGIIVGEMPLDFDHSKKIGVKLMKDVVYSCKFFCCYEPCEFEEIDYGKALDKGIFKRIKSKMSKQSTENDYSLTFPDDIRCKSARSIRFEYRFENSKMEGMTKTQRGRSEISGVHSSSLMGKWIIEFDLFIPHKTKDDKESRDCITQLHDYSSVALSPAFSIGMIDGELYCRLRGDCIPVEKWEKRNEPKSGAHIFKMGKLEKDVWHHVKIYLKLAYQHSMMPQTIIWVDSEKIFESDLPNCYNYEPKKAGMYDYIKFGIYKSSWLGKKKRPTDTDKRIYYFDNYKVKY